MTSCPQERPVGDASRPTVRRRRIDQSRSLIGFRIRKLGLYFVKGRFGRVDGWVEVDEAGIPRRAEVEIEAASISTGMSPRDWHLRSRDFLDVGRHRIIHVKVDDVRLADTELQAEAQLIVHGTSGPVQLGGHLHDDGSTGKLQIQGALDRHSFGVRARPPFDWIVGREVQIDALIALER